MKRIVQRNLPLTVKYTLINKQYIPLSEGYGCCCDNCGKLISNQATVRNTNNETFVIGFDCFETLLINNSLLSNHDITEYEAVKKMIPKIIKFSKTIKAVIDINKGLITGLKFDPLKYGSDYIPFYWLTNNQTISRNNDYVKLKDMNFDFLIETLRNIFPNLMLITGNN